MLEPRKRKISIPKLIDAVIILSFTLFFIRILLNGKIHLYVHPRIIPYVFFAVCYLVIIFAVTLTEIFKTRQRQGGRRFYHIVLMVTLAIAFAIPPATLNANNGGSKLDINLSSQGGTSKTGVVPQASQSTEVTGTADGQTGSEVAPSDTPEEPDEDAVPDFIKVDDSNYVSMLYDICDRMDAYDGKEIELLGFVYKEDKFSNKQFVIGRYLMSCCTADLELIGLMGEYDGASALKNDNWISVKGVIEKGTYDGEPIPVIKIQEINNIPPPKDEYVYP